MREVSESPEERREEHDEDPLPTIHRRVMLTDLPESGLADIARRLQLTRPEAEVAPVIEFRRAADPMPMRQPVPAPAPTSPPAPTPPAAPGPALTGLPAAELDELAQALFARVVDAAADPRRPTTHDLYARLRRAEVDRVDAFVYRVEVGRSVVIVRPSAARAEARPLRRFARATAGEVDVWVGVPIATILDPPADLLDAAYHYID